MVVSEHRILELNGLRGIAVVMVLVWHFVGSIISPRLRYALEDRIKRFRVWPSGRRPLFVLSGFLIIGILTDRREGPYYFLPFYLRRD